MWIARDKKSGELTIFSEKPILDEEGDMWITDRKAHYLFHDYKGDCVDNAISLDQNAFPEVTFENSPIELIPKVQPNMYIARDKDGDLGIYESIPEKRGDLFLYQTGSVMYINPELFPEVNWENSPKEIKIIII